ncbi:hypothetical protein B0H11DRAFT_2232771 [Mycena galericulata]|nr:hypothetical protein B0H11DRAFT_2232771 [Mycena galericulata]
MPAQLLTETAQPLTGPISEWYNKFYDFEGYLKETVPDVCVLALIFLSLTNILSFTALMLKHFPTHRLLIVDTEGERSISAADRCILLSNATNELTMSLIAFLVFIAHQVTSFLAESPTSLLHNILLLSGTVLLNNGGAADGT